MPQPPSRPRSTRPQASTPPQNPRTSSRSQPRTNPRTNPRQPGRSSQPTPPRRDRSPWQRFVPKFLNLEATSLEQGLGKILVAVGAGTIVGVVGLLPTVNRLHCDREGQYYSVCRVRRFSLVGLPLGSALLDPLQGAQPEPNQVTSGYGTRVLLLSQRGRVVPLSVYGTTWETCDRTTDRINAALGNPEVDSFTIWDLVPSPLLLTALLGGGSLGAAGIGLLWIAQAKTPIRAPQSPR